MKIIAKSELDELEVEVQSPIGERFNGTIIKENVSYKKGEYHSGFVSDNFSFSGLDPIEIKLPKEKSVLLQAESIVNNDRNEQYGDANAAFELYSEILKTTFGIDLTPSDVCKVMIAVKLGRLKYKYKEDSIIDTCGYLELLNRLEKNK